MADVPPAIIVVDARFRGEAAPQYVGQAVYGRIDTKAIARALGLQGVRALKFYHFKAANQPEVVALAEICFADFKAPRGFEMLPSQCFKPDSTNFGDAWAEKMAPFTYKF